MRQPSFKCGIVRSAAAISQLAARAAAVLAALALLATPAGGAWARELDLTVRPVPLNYTAPEQERIGRLVWRGGIDISSPDERFGGISGLLISEDGAKLTAVTDEGFWLTGTMHYDAEGTLIGLSGVDLRRLRGETGKPLSGKTDQDAEAMTALADGTIVVAYERNHRLLRYAPRESPLRNKAEALPVPASLNGLPPNGGIEAMATLADDAILAIAEGLDDDTESLAFLWRGGVWSELRYAHTAGYRPAGAARLPDGDVLVLERRFTVLEGVGIRLLRLPAAAIGPGALLQPVEIARLLPPLTVDNFEAVDVRRGERGETLIYLVSDDNFNIFQRTLLFMFALEE